MTDKKQCSKCKVFQSLNYSKNECKQCKLCLEAKQGDREKNQDKLREYARQYDYRKNEQTVVCPVCENIINKYQVKRHEENSKHQNKVKGKEQPHVIRNGENESGIMRI